MRTGNRRHMVDYCVDLLLREIAVFTESREGCIDLLADFPC